VSPFLPVVLVWLMVGKKAVARIRTGAHRPPPFIALPDARALRLPTGLMVAGALTLFVCQLLRSVAGVAYERVCAYSVFMLVLVAVPFTVARHEQQRRLRSGSSAAERSVSRRKRGTRPRFLSSAVDVTPVLTPQQALM
jgi:hypothetical protein